MFGPVLQAYAKRLFRLLWRALRFWPEQQSLTALVDLWMTYALPWVPLQALQQSGHSSKTQALHPLQNLGHSLLRHQEQPNSSGSDSFLPLTSIGLLDMSSHPLSLAN